eukprot:2794026-Pyramimonas_sp.AAC.1
MRQPRAMQWLAHAGSMLRAALQRVEAAAAGASERPFQMHGGALKQLRPRADASAQLIEEHRARLDTSETSLFDRTAGLR